MMAIMHGEMTITTNRRVITIQQVNQHDRFLALVGCGVRESFAAAVVAKIITMKVRV